MKNSKTVYFIFSFLFALIVVCGYDLNFSLFLRDENPETFCSTANILNYTDFALGHYFHWFIRDNPCRFNTIILLNHNWLLITYYALLKFYGARQNLNTISLRVIVLELLIYMIMYLIKITLQTNISWTLGSILNAAAGFIQLHNLFIIFALSLVLGKLIFFKTELSALWRKHKIVYATVLLVLSSAMIFPIFSTLVLCFFAAPIGFMYVYYILPQILNSITCNQCPKPTVHQKLFLAFGGFVFFILETFLLLYIRLNDTIFNTLPGLYILTVAVHLIYYSLAITVILPQKLKK